MISISDEHCCSLHNVQAMQRRSCQTCAEGINRDCHMTSIALHDASPSKHDCSELRHLKPASRQGASRRGCTYLVTSPLPDTAQSNAAVGFHLGRQLLNGLHLPLGISCRTCTFQYTLFASFNSSFCSCKSLSVAKARVLLKLRKVLNANHGCVMFTASITKTYA